MDGWNNVGQISLIFLHRMAITLLLKSLPARVSPDLKHGVDYDW